MESPGVPGKGPKRSTRPRHWEGPNGPRGQWGKAREAQGKCRHNTGNGLVGARGPSGTWGKARETHVVLGECPRGPTGHRESPRGPMRLRGRPHHARHVNFALITFVLTHARKNARPRGRDLMGERVHTRIHVR